MIHADIQKSHQRVLLKMAAKGGACYRSAPQAFVVMGGDSARRINDRDMRDMFRLIQFI